MSKLKTLKDLKYHISVTEDKSKSSNKKSLILHKSIEEQDLRNEAIKWIKELEKGFKSDSNVNSEGDSFIALVFGLSNDGLIDWIKGFFNIEEKNLK